MVNEKLGSRLMPYMLLWYIWFAVGLDWSHYCMILAFKFVLDIAGDWIASYRSGRLLSKN